MTARRRWRWMAVTLLSLGGSILAASPADGQIDDTNGAIVFERGLPPAVGIGSANLDDTNREGVIEAIEFDDRDPTVAPDGEQVAFSRNMDGNEEIFTRPLGPGEGRRLTDDPRRDLDPAWQPCQGGSIAWSRDGDIWVMNRDGSAPRQLTIGADVDEQPSWSPDCDAIVFTRAGAGLHVVNVRTGSVEARPEFGAAARDPEWGPGGQIVYTAPGDDGIPQVFRGSRQLTATPTQKRFPVVSPDTTQIAFSEVNHVTVLSADGEREIGRIDGATDPAWSRMPAAGRDERPNAGETFILRPFAYDGTEFREGIKKMPEGDEFPTVLRDRAEVDAVVGLDVPPDEKVRVDARVEGAGTSVLTLANGFFSVVQDDATDGPVATFQGGPGLDDCPGYPRARPAGRGKGRGRGKTKGGHTSASTKGTEWELEETCAFTRITVFEGSVEVDAPGDQFDRADLGPADSPYVIPNPG